MSAHPSIRRRLLTSLISTILLVWMVVLVLVYRAAQHEVEEVFDADLARGAGTLQALLLHEVEEEQEKVRDVETVLDELGSEGIAMFPKLAAILQGLQASDGKEVLELSGAVKDAEHRYRGKLAFIARYQDGTVMMHDGWPAATPVAPEGYSDLQLGDASWRVFGLSDPESGFLVQIGEQQAFRSELVRYITRNTLMPLLLVLPIIGLLIWAVVGHALAPLQRVADEVGKRAPDATDPIDDGGTPHEVHGLLKSLNQLFRRVGSAMQFERQFTADAAHELRTPLSGLKTHLQVAQGQAKDPAMRRSLDQALQGVDRATHSVEQLLLLARADADQTRSLVSAHVNLRELVEQVVGTLSQRAVERDIDLGIEGPAAVRVNGDAASLQLLLRNLVDNAVRYTPEGGMVTVSCGDEPGGAWLQVIDNGVGVAAADFRKIFNRFHRGADEQAKGTSGSGLGLSIVRRVADLHRAKIELQPGLDGRGLCIRVVFPSVANSFEE